MVQPHSSHGVCDQNAEQVNQLSRTFWSSVILRAGTKLGVFSILECISISSEGVVRRINASPRFVQAFLDSCSALGLLAKNGSAYTDSHLASKFLVHGKQEYLGDLVLHLTNHWGSWGQLDLLILLWQKLFPFETKYVDAPTYWANYIIGQQNRATSGQADHLDKNVDLRTKRKIPDLGGGAASYSIALCQANPLPTHLALITAEKPSL